ncbi:MAG: hypothetical protein ACE5G0_09885 [Rhodothermales bacterium]
MVQLAAYIVIALVSLSLLMMLGFGIRSLVYGKVNTITTLIVALPIILLGILYLVMGNWAEAAILTVLTMFALAILSLLFTGFKSLFT